MEKLFKTIFVVFIILVCICLWVGLLVAIPLSAIWSVNTLIGLGIDYTFSNWLAAFILITIFGTSTSNKMVSALDK